MANLKENIVCVEDLAAGELPERLLSAIGSMELTVEELVEWDRGKPPLRLIATREHLVLEVTMRIPIKKVLALVGAVLGAALAGSKLLVQFGPTLQKVLERVWS
jgi:hypothetical protein